MHLPELVKNEDPNEKFIKVDFPDDYDPLTVTTITQSLYFQLFLLLKLL